MNTRSFKKHGARVGLIAGLAALALHETPARAEGEIDAEFFGGGHFFNDNNPLGRSAPPMLAPGFNNSGMVGLRLGYLPFPRLTLEGEVGLVPTATHFDFKDPTMDGVSVSMVAIRAHLLFNVLTGRVRPFVLLGGGGQISLPAGTSVVKTDAEGEFHVGAGLKVDLVKDQWGLRLDGRAIFPQGISRALTAEGEILGSIYGRFDVQPTPNVPLPGVVDAPNPAQNMAQRLDRDGDGVVNAKDKCPDQAGPAANQGCPDQDSDNDGIVDRLDKCPNEPETKNGYQDEDGCPDELPRALVQFTGAIKGVNFGSGDAVIARSSYKVLDQAVEVLKESGGVRLEIAGHTDNQGQPELNRVISQERADAVRKYLVDRGIDAGRLTAVGYGPDKPIADNTSANGRAKNRRVEFTLLTR